MQRMSPQDASFLHVEDDNNHMHIGSVTVFEGPPPSHEEFLARVEAKLPKVPRYRQRVRFVPMELGRPVWVDDPHFHVDYHVRRTALPAPGGDEQLRLLVGRLMSQQLDRTKPLWEIWVVEGLEDDHWSMISKVHHCMVDGVAGTDLLSVILDRERDAPVEPGDSWHPEPEPSNARLLADAVADRAISPYEQVRGMRASLRAPRQAARTVGGAVKGGASLVGLARPTVATSLSGPIGPHRRWNWARTTLADVKTVRNALGGTVNDVVLTVITRGFRDLLQSRDEPVEGRVIRSLVPVSVRPPDKRETYDNRVSAMFAELPVGLADPVERLHAVTAQMRDLKDSAQAMAGDALVALSGFAPPTLLALGTRLAFKLPQRSITTVTTNVPGPQEPLYAAGRQLLEMFPYVPIAGQVRVGVAIISYLGTLNYGVTGDYDTAPDIAVLCHGIEEGMAELLKAAAAG